jgi:STE24 endopeptidase
MTHLLVIGILVVAALRDFAPEESADWARAALGPAGVAAASLAPFALLALFQTLWAWRTLRRVDRGRPASLHTFETVSALVRGLALPLHAAAVLAFGWLDLIRDHIGDPVAIDELLAVLPAFTLLAISWAAAAPIEQRAREALLIRRLDEGLAIPPMPRKRTWWWSTVRQQLLFPAAPVVLILAWAETVGIVRDALWQRMLVRGGWEPSAHAWTRHAPDWLLDQHLIAYGSAALQLAGVVALLALLPIALRLLWDTTPLGPGPLRDGLRALCETYNVRVRAILVWRTHGAMLNGAVVGFLPRLRYIVLTDALLESLPGAQVEAVAAHELAHVRHRHIPWLAAGLAGSALCFGGALALLARLAGFDPMTTGWGPPALLVVVILASVLVFGKMSRTFERQADLFAAAHLTRRFQGPDTARIAEAGARLMAETLRAVALINGQPTGGFSFRHGSIDARRRRLLDATGEPIDRTEADRAARRVKRLAAALVLMGTLLALADALGPQGT